MATIKSIEEKAKAYDNIIEKANKMYSENCEACQMCIEELIPELKESEDEKIRKEIIELVMQPTWKTEKEFHRRNELCVWLEKQGEQNQKHFELKAEHWYICHRAYCCRADHLTVKEGERFMCEKDGVVKGFIVKEPEKYFKEVCAPAPMEGEQNPANKVKPKFEIGDLITNGILVGKIDEIHELGYHAYFGDHYADVPDVENWHLWTIEDAKDGDVLVASDGSIFLFKGTIDCACKHYVALTTDGAFKFNEGLEHFWETSRAVHPATKEQCDLLFQKMHEAGYEWDAEKKELKKIEQNPTQETEPFEAEHGKYYYCIKDYFCGGRKQASKGDVIQALRGLPIMGLKDASEYFLPVNFIKCYSTWSEEDEYIIEEIEAIIDAYVLEENNPKALIDWLKSLKERYTWRPSDEQMDALHYVTNFDYGGHKATLVSLYEQLKKLKG